MPTAPALATLRDENAVLAVLLDLMKQEQQCLVDADSGALSALTPQKAQLVGQMGDLSRQRHQALAAAGFEASEAGMQAWLDSAGDPAASALWHDLLSATRIAKEMNRLNGMLINKQLAYTQGAISAMHSPAGGGDAGVYGPSGKTTPAGPSRGFVAG